MYLCLDYRANIYWLFLGGDGDIAKAIEERRDTAPGDVEEKARRAKERHLEKLATDRSKPVPNPKQNQRSENQRLLPAERDMILDVFQDQREKGLS